MPKKYHIITYGCQMNKSDSRTISLFLEKKGYKKSLKQEKADLIVVNMCSVRQSAVDRVFGLSRNLAKLKTDNPRLKTILTGCILKSDRKKFIERFDEIKDKTDYLKVRPGYENDSLAYIPISNGCNNYCSYCVVPFVRGRLVCYSHKKILSQIRAAIKNKVKNIWLLGQNVNDYKSPDNKRINFSRLVKMVDGLPGNFIFFFTSPHPKNFSNQLIAYLADCKKFGYYINLPLQSGSNLILKKMNRKYKAEEYCLLVEKIRKSMPQIKLSTDIIVGFPGEGQKEFYQTVNLVKKIKFNWAYISKYSPRQGTTAYALSDNVCLAEKKKRERILRQIINEKNK